MNILEQIVAKKILEVKDHKALYPVSALERSEFFRKKPVSFSHAITNEGSSGIIAEFKRRSPSKGVINENARAQEVCAGYALAGASAISVLTNHEFFGGSTDDLAEARRSVSCPILCKDFIIDEYQIIEARSCGADAVLLIADIHTDQRLDALFHFASSLEMEALIEVHDKEYLSRMPGDASVVGINSRNLASFSVSLDHACSLADLLPGSVVKVAESGIKSVDDYFIMKNAGFDAFLIGEFFMSSADPAQACKAFIETTGRKLVS
ncbi:MAG: indole-3-glycerol phosphate synthase TrpC [Chloroflexota bacterium]